MRCFIAIEFDEMTKDLLAKLQDSLAKSGIKGNYTHRDNFHLTLKFLGEINQTTVNKIKSVLGKVTTNREAFVLDFAGLGKFSKGAKSIIWCGLEPNSHLNGLQRGLEMAIEALLPQQFEQGGFSPHITLVREASFMNSEIDGAFALKELMAGKGKLEHHLPIDGLSLMESARVDGKLRYVQQEYFSFM